MGDLLQFPGRHFPRLGWVRGPYPKEWSHTVVPTTDSESEAVRRAQRELGITVDGILGPQTWVAIAHAQEGKP